MFFVNTRKQYIAFCLWLWHIKIWIWVILVLEEMCLWLTAVFGFCSYLMKEMMKSLLSQAKASVIVKFFAKGLGGCITKEGDWILSLVSKEAHLWNTQNIVDRTCCALQPSTDYVSVRRLFWGWHEGRILSFSPTHFQSIRNINASLRESFVSRLWGAGRG